MLSSRISLYTFPRWPHLLDIGQKFQPKAGHQNCGWYSSPGKDNAKSLSSGNSCHNGCLQGRGKIRDKCIRLSSLCCTFCTILIFSMNMLIGHLAVTRISYRAGISYTTEAMSHLSPNFHCHPKQPLIPHPPVVLPVPGTLHLCQYRLSGR